MKACLFAIMPFMAFIHFAQAQSVDSLSMANYRITSYCVAKTTPNNIIRLDNNDRILMACARGMTIGQLKELGLAVTESQIQLLLDWDLLLERNDTLYTGFPILHKDETNSLRKTIKEKAAILAKSLKPEIHALTVRMDRSKQQRNTYTILFSYILDDLVWHDFEKRGAVQERKLSVEHPFWSGVTWATAPKRTFYCGTNSYSDSGITVTVNWSPAATSILSAFMYDYQVIDNLINEFRKTNATMDHALTQRLQRYKIVDNTGAGLIPVITENDDDSLYNLCRTLASRVSAFIISTVDLGSLRNQYGLSSPEEALVIAYHEFMWEFMDIVESKGLIKKPPLFYHPESAKASDIGDVVYIVRSTN